jgi:hypothetical protein
MIAQIKEPVYNVLGDIVPNTDMNKYKINSKGTEQIDISVLNVSQNDSGIYQSVDLSARPNGCFKVRVIQDLGLFRFWFRQVSWYFLFVF